MRFFPVSLAWILGVSSGGGSIRRRRILRGGDGIPERQQPNQARYSDGDCFSGMFAAGLILVYCSQTRRTSDHILFGDMLGITIGDIIQTVIIAGWLHFVISVNGGIFAVQLLIINRRPVPSGFAYEMAALWAAVMVPLTIVATLKAVGIILHFSAHCARRHCGTPDAMDLLRFAGARSVYR